MQFLHHTFYPQEKIRKYEISLQRGFHYKQSNSLRNNTLHHT